MHRIILRHPPFVDGTPRGCDERFTQGCSAFRITTRKAAPDPPHRHPRPTARAGNSSERGYRSGNAGRADENRQHNGAEHRARRAEDSGNRGGIRSRRENSDRGAFASTRDVYIGRAERVTCFPFHRAQGFVDAPLKSRLSPREIDQLTNDVFGHFAIDCLFEAKPPRCTENAMRAEHAVFPQTCRRRRDVTRRYSRPRRNLLNLREGISRDSCPRASRHFRCLVEYEGELFFRVQALAHTDNLRRRVSFLRSVL